MSYALFVRGYGAKDPERVQRLIQAVGVSARDAPLCIAARFPRMVSAYADFDAAAEALSKLHDQALEGFIAATDEINRLPTVALAGRVEFGPDFVTWWHAHRETVAPPELGIVEGRTIRQERAHVRAILRACVRWKTRIETQVTENVRVGFLNVAVRQSAESRTEGDREQVLLVKGAGYDSFVWIGERSFNFSSLGSERTYGPGANIGRLAEKLRSTFPDARYDDSLMQFTGEMGFEFRSGRTGVASSSMTEQIRAAHDSTAASLLHMARLIAMQEGLA